MSHANLETASALAAELRESGVVAIDREEISAPVFSGGAPIREVIISAQNITLDDDVVTAFSRDVTELGGHDTPSAPLDVRRYLAEEELRDTPFRERGE